MPPGPTPPGPLPPEPTPFIPADPIGLPTIIALSLGEVVARSQDSGTEAAATNSGIQIGAEDSTLRFQGDDSAAESNKLSNILAVRHLQTLSQTREGPEASVTQNLQNIGFDNSSLDGVKVSGTYLINASELLEICLDASELVRAEVKASSIAARDSLLHGGSGADVFRLEALEGLLIEGFDQAHEADLDLSLSAIGMENSMLLAGHGDDAIDIVAAIASGPTSGEPLVDTTFTDLMDDLRKRLGNEAALPHFREHPGATGIDLQFSDHPKLNTASIELNLNASALSNGSLIDSGEGNDRITLFSLVNNYLEGDLGVLEKDLVSLNEIGNLHSTLKINREQISMDNSTILTGAGDDLIVARGDIINSLIDTGSGFNQVLLWGEIDPNSTISSSNGELVLIQFPLEQRIETLSTNDDEWEVRNLSELALLDGLDGNDTINSSGAQHVDAVGLYGDSPDQGSLWTMPFQSIENLNLGDGDDLVVMEGQGGLSGHLNLGEGDDTLDYSNYSQGVHVDFREGTATGLGGGVSGLNRVIGSAFDDIFVFPWTPGQSPLVEQHAGWRVDGGGGSDTFIFESSDDEEVTSWTWLPSIQINQDAASDRVLIRSELGAELVEQPIANLVPLATPQQPLEHGNGNQQPSGLAQLGLLTPSDGTDLLVGGTANLQEITPLANLEREGSLNA